MSRPTTRTEKLDMETVSLIKGLCAEFGILRSTYYERSDLNAPGEGQISYTGLLAAMNGGGVTPRQEARVARSLGQVRQALRKAGRLPIAKALPAQLKSALAEYENDPDVFAPGELGTIRRVLNLVMERLNAR